MLKIFAPAQQFLKNYLKLVKSLPAKQIILLDGFLSRGVAFH
jgi:hypothetical protein